MLYAFRTLRTAAGPITRMASTYSRLVRFVPRSSSTPLLGEPTDPNIDVGLAAYAGEDIEVAVFSGSSILKPGERTTRREKVERVLSPLTQEEVGTIRCIGLNYLRHAKEVNMAIPTVPVLFMKPATSLGDPYPAPTIMPAAYAETDSADYESELAVIIGKPCKNVSEEEAMDYVLGYTASNDVSSRHAQLIQSQWCHSKGFDTACPIGPAFVPAHKIGDYKQLLLKGTLRRQAEGEGVVMQESKLDDLIFGIPKIVSFLSQGTTLPAGCVILTGTPMGVGMSAQPKVTLQAGDEFRVFISGGIGTLINRFEIEGSGETLLDS